MYYVLKINRENALWPVCFSRKRIRRVQVSRRERFRNVIPARFNWIAFAEIRSNRPVSDVLLLVYIACTIDFILTATIRFFFCLFPERLREPKRKQTRYSCVGSKRSPGVYRRALLSTATRARRFSLLVLNAIRVCCMWNILYKKKQKKTPPPPRRRISVFRKKKNK